MFNRFLPQRIDNAYRGHQLALWLFAAVVFMKTSIGLLCILALVRYRAMVPFMFTLLLLEHLGRKLILFVMPIAKTGTPPGLFINLALVAVMIVGLVLALRTEGNALAGH